MRGLFVVFVCALLGVTVSGCAAITIVDTAVDVTSTVVGTTVDVAAGAVGAVAGSSDDDEDVDCDDEENKEHKACKKEKASKP